MVTPQVAPESRHPWPASIEKIAPHQALAARVAGLYLIAGLAWIGLSDLTLTLSGGLTTTGLMISASKGVAFVLLSAGLVYWLCRREYREIKRATDLLQAVVEGTTDAVFVKDLAGRYQLVNAAAARFIGRTVQEVIGRDDRGLFAAPEAERLMASDREIMFGGRVVTLEEILTSDGITRTYQATKAPFVDASGALAGLIGISRNITEHKRVEAALRESDARLREAQRIARMGSWSWEPQTDRVWWSDAEFELFGLAPQSLIPSFNAFLALVHPDDRATAINRVEAMKAGSNEMADDLRIVRGDGSCIWIHSQARATRDNSGKLILVEGTDQDITEQRRSREAAIESERRLHAAVEVAELGILTIDYQSNTARLSHRAAEQYGFSADQVVTRQELHSRFHPEDAAELSKLMAAALDPTGSGWFAAEHRVVRSDGTIRWLNVRKQVFFEEGRPQRAVLVAADVTDRRSAEARLREQEMLVREAAELAQVGGWGFDPTTLQSDWTPAVARMYGLDQPPLANEALEFFAMEQRPSLAVAFESAIRDGIGFEMELQLNAADGVTRWVRTICRPIVEHQRVVRVRGSLQDISDYKRIVFDHERSAAMLRSVLDSVGDAIITIDTRGNVTSANRASELMFGYSASELVGINARALLSEPNQTQHDHYLADFKRSDLPRIAGVGREIECRRKDGTTFPAEMTITQFARDGEPEYTGVLRDITARRHLEDQFRQAQKMEAVGRLAGGVAHDFNNLLTVINGYSEMMLSGLPVNDPARSPLTAIHDAGNRAARLTGQLLAFSRKSIIEPRLVNLNELVSESARLFRRMIGEDITLSVLTEPAPIFVVIDPSQLEQVLMNLAVNARDAMPTGGRLTIETKSVELEQSGDRMPADLPKGHYASLRVTDTGSGMDAAVREKIFDPFFTTKGLGKGTGLGLAVVHGIVQQSGGSITVESMVDAGTSFHILLPAVTDTTKAVALKESSVAPRGDETILVVEDADAVRALARVSLEAQGYRVLTASGGSQARELLLDYPRPIDLLITDVIMPEMSGRELAAALRSIQPRLRILYISGYTDDALDRHGLEGTADQFMQKPFTPLGLARRVREILDQTD